MVADARANTKDWLNNLDNSKLLKDNGSTQVMFIVAYGWPDYPMEKVFLTKGVDLTFSILDPTSEPLLGADQYPTHYRERVPIVTTCIDKTGITGTKLRWQTNAELRRLGEVYPTGSQWAFKAEEPFEKRLGSTTLYQQRFTMGYLRNLT